MTNRRILLALLAATAWASTVTWAQTAPDPSRGQLLYATHCSGCHTSQVHWRDQKVASDWSSLMTEVRRWQARERLNWNDTDILYVTRHLNDTIYRFEQPANQAGTAADPGVGRPVRIDARGALPAPAKAPSKPGVG